MILMYKISENVYKNDSKDVIVMHIIAQTFLVEYKIGPELLLLLLRIMSDDVSLLSMTSKTAQIGRLLLWLLELA